MDSRNRLDMLRNQQQPQQQYQPPQQQYQQPQQYQQTYGSSNDYSDAQYRQQPSQSRYQDPPAVSQNTYPPPSNAPPPSGANTLTEGEFYRQLGSIRTEIQGLQRTTASIGSLQDRVNTAVNESSADSQALEGLRATSQKQIRSIKSNTKALVTAYNTPGGLQTQDPENVKRQIETLKEQFRTALQEYQTVLATSRSKQRQKIERQYRIVNPNASQSEIEEVLQTENPQIFAQAFMSSQRYGDARTTMENVQSRHRDIQQIERSMTELMQLFTDLHDMVLTQHEQLVYTQQQAVQIHDDTEKAKVELDGAVVSARAARNKRRWCLGICVAIVIIVAVVLVVYFLIIRKGAPGNSNNNQSPATVTAAGAVATAVTAAAVNTANAIVTAVITSATGSPI